ncbi:hypothetical protein [Glutamicibacter sp. NPDC088455]|uniref:hypothetical protein n=2 Tax=unclassified Glutamicibacter TaxID=2627139 RepID=UPI0037FC5E6A
MNFAMTWLRLGYTVWRLAVGRGEAVAVGEGLAVPEADADPARSAGPPVLQPETSAAASAPSPRLPVFSAQRRE